MKLVSVEVDLLGYTNVVGSCGVSKVLVFVEVIYIFESIIEIIKYSLSSTHT